MELQGWRGPNPLQIVHKAVSTHRLRGSACTRVGKEGWVPPVTAQPSPSGNPPQATLTLCFAPRFQDKCRLETGMSVLFPRLCFAPRRRACLQANRRHKFCYEKVIVEKVPGSHSWTDSAFPAPTLSSGPAGLRG